MKAIKDSVHDYIEIDGVALDLLDTAPVQRLRHISQLGTVTLVYPSANHTRFEHSLGVYHLANRALSHLGVEGQQAERARAAALLHDVGHGPYSHNVEELIYRHTGKYHDEVHDLLDTGAVAAVLESHGIDPDAVADLVAGDGELGQLISGELDVDRMDYLARDAHHTGVPYGTIDHGRLVRELQFVDGELVLNEGNVQAAESLLLARALMNPVVYMHHVARIAKTMLRRGTERLLESTSVTAEQLRRMDDKDLLVALRSHDVTEGYGERISYRELFKRGVWAEMDAVPEELIEADHDEKRRLEREIAAEAGVDSDFVVMDIPEKPTLKETTSRVVVGGEIRALEAQSTLVQALREAQYDQWRLGVYAPEDINDRVGEAAVRVLGLDVDDARVSDVRFGLHTTLDDFE